MIISPKPFTPLELRTTVSKALIGDYDKVKISDKERDSIEIMDLDLDFGGRPTTSSSRKNRAKNRSNFRNSRPVGQHGIDVMEKLGTTCKTGVKKNFCPKLKARAKRQKSGGFQSQNHDALTSLLIMKKFWL